MNAALLAACRSREDGVSWGDSGRGEQLIRAYGCGSCHSIPGIQRAESRIGPPLEDIRERVYIAGVVPNTPQDLMHWIEHPRQVDPRTAMPELGVADVDAPLAPQRRNEVIFDRLDEVLSGYV